MDDNNDIRNFKILTIYSTATYLISYVLVYLIFSSITILVANIYHIETILYHDKLFFLTPDNSPLWDFDSAIYVFGAGTRFCVILMAALMIFFHKIREEKTFFKIFVFWFILHLINRMISTFILGSLIDLYFSNVVFDWLYFDRWLDLVLAIFSLFLLITIGNFTTRSLLLASRSFQLIKSNKRSHYVWYQAITPWFISSVIIMVMHLPSFAYIENLLSGFMFIIVSSTYFNFRTIKMPSVALKNDPPFPIPVKLIAFTVVFLISFRIIFQR